LDRNGQRFVGSGISAAPGRPENEQYAVLPAHYQVRLYDFAYVDGSGVGVAVTHTPSRRTTLIGEIRIDNNAIADRRLEKDVLTPLVGMLGRRATCHSGRQHHSRGTPPEGVVIASIGAVGSFSHHEALRDELEAALRENAPSLPVIDRRGLADLVAERQRERGGTAAAEHRVADIALYGKAWWEQPDVPAFWVAATDLKRGIWLGDMVCREMDDEALTAFATWVQSLRRPQVEASRFGSLPSHVRAALAIRDTERLNPEFRTVGYFSGRSPTPSYKVGNTTALADVVATATNDWNAGRKEMALARLEDAWLHSKSPNSGSTDGSPERLSAARLLATWYHATEAFNAEADLLKSILDSTLLADGKEAEVADFKRRYMRARMLGRNRPDPVRDTGNGPTDAKRDAADWRRGNVKTLRSSFDKPQLLRRAEVDGPYGVILGRGAKGVGFFLTMREARSGGSPMKSLETSPSLPLLFPEQINRAAAYLDRDVGFYRQALEGLAGKPMPLEYTDGTVEYVVPQFHWFRGAANEQLSLQGYGVCYTGQLWDQFRAHPYKMRETLLRMKEEEVAKTFAGWYVRRSTAVFARARQDGESLFEAVMGLTLAEKVGEKDAPALRGLIETYLDENLQWPAPDPIPKGNRTWITGGYAIGHPVACEYIRNPDLLVRCLEGMDSEELRFLADNVDAPVLALAFAQHRHPSPEVFPWHSWDEFEQAFFTWRKGQEIPVAHHAERVKAWFRLMPPRHEVEWPPQSVDLDF
jgi:hypothetical protein